MNPEDAKRKIEVLEESLRNARAEAAKYKQDTYALLSELVPYEPLTEAEVQRMLSDPNGTPILDIVTELELA